MKETINMKYKYFDTSNDEGFCDGWKVIITNKSNSQKDYKVEISTYTFNPEFKTKTYFLNDLLAKTGFKVFNSVIFPIWNIRKEDFLEITNWLVKQAAFFDRTTKIAENFDSVCMSIKESSSNVNFFVLMVSIKKQYLSNITFKVEYTTALLKTLTDLCFGLYAKENFLNTDKVAKALLTYLEYSGKVSTVTFLEDFSESMLENFYYQK